MLKPVATGIPLKPMAFGGGYEGAEHFKRETASWMPSLRSPDAAINLVKTSADLRSQDMLQNDGYAAGAVAIHKDSIVGAQFMLNAMPDYKFLGADIGWAEEFQEYVESYFNLIAESPANWLDASRKNTLTTLVRLALGSWYQHGEVLASVEWVREVRRPVYTAFQMISPHRLSNANGVSNNRFLRNGVTRDIRGKALTYDIRQGFPGDFTDPNAFEWATVSAEKPWGRKQVIHIMEQLSPDQTRGISAMVTSLQNMKMTKKFQEITLQNAVINASYAAAIESEIPEAAFTAMGGQQMAAGSQGYMDLIGAYLQNMGAYINGGNNIQIDGAKIPMLFPGTKLSMQPMGTPGGVGSTFEASLLRHTAASLDLSYEELARDYTKTNYSSARAAMTNTWKSQQAKKKMVADRFANEMYSAVLEEMISDGNIPLPKSMRNGEFWSKPLYKEAICKATWIGASRGQIDELKETQAAVMRIAAGLSTYEIEAGRLGIDFRHLFEQMSREKNLMLSLGLEPVLTAQKATATTALAAVAAEEETPSDPQNDPNLDQ